MDFHTAVESPATSPRHSSQSVGTVRGPIPVQVGGLGGHRGGGDGCLSPPTPWVTADGKHGAKSTADGTELSSSEVAAHAHKPP